MLRCVIARRPGAAFSRDCAISIKTRQYLSLASPFTLNRRMKTATKTLLALTTAAAFGGFAATGLNLMLEQPAQAAPTPAAAVPAAAALPTAVNGTPMPSLAPMLKRVLPAVVSVNTKQRVRVNTPFGDDRRR